MISQNLVDKLNEQINKELYSSYIYLSMSAFFETKSLKGFARWFAAQSAEERGHAMKIYQYLLDQGSRVVLDAIAKPPSEYSSLIDVVEKTYEHEKFITASINSLMAAAIKENDYATQIFLQWFVTEQVEEEASVLEVLENLKMVGDHGPALLALDHALGTRGS